ncbi:MAG: type IV secretory system conjugative DNA transfer family protein [Lachnospiraceae bacterium]|nr:type IV secretory system conjugative DNA transfer family protein [Lachnospiraceae bacterium]
MLQAFGIGVLLNGYSILGAEKVTDAYLSNNSNLITDFVRAVMYGLGYENGRLVITLMLAGLIYIIWYFWKLKQVVTKQNIDEELNAIDTEEGTLGTAHEMTEAEFGYYYQRTPIEKSKGYVLGTEFEEKAEIGKSGKQDNSKITKVVEKLDKEKGGETGPHTYVAGPSGCGKTFRFIYPNVCNAIRAGKSVFITDPKGEIYNMTHVFAEKHGAKVAVLNLVDPIVSDGVNFVTLIGRDEAMAQTVAGILIANSEGDANTKKDFWTNGGLALTTFGLLYVSLVDDVKDKTLAGVYRLLTEPDQESLATIERDSNGNPINDSQKGSAVFNKLQRLVEPLPATHPARKQWNIFMTAPDGARDSVFMDVGTRLYILNDSILGNVLGHNDIDLELPMKEQCVYYIITDTESDRYDAVASMFFSLSFYKLCRYAKKHIKRRPVDFFLDEFPSIGTIPNFVKLISLVRSQGISLTIVSQDLGQLIEKYPGHVWESILSNCDTQVVLGVNDHKFNGEYWASKTGEKTGYAERSNISGNGVINPSTMSSGGSLNVQARTVLTSDEVMRMKGHGRQGVLVFTAYAPFKLLKKVNFSEYPAGKEIFENEQEYLYKKVTYFHEPKWWDEIKAAREADIKHEKDFNWFDIAKADINELQECYIKDYAEEKAEKEEKKQFKKREANRLAKEQAAKGKTLEEIYNERKENTIKQVEDKLKGFVPDMSKFVELKEQVKDKALDLLYKVLNEKRPDADINDDNDLVSMDESVIVKNNEVEVGEEDEAETGIKYYDDSDITDTDITSTFGYTKAEYKNADNIITEPDQDEEEFIKGSKESRTQVNNVFDESELDDMFGFGADLM